MMRVMLYEAAQVMLTRTNKWSWLKAWAMQVASAAATFGISHEHHKALGPFRHIAPREFWRHVIADVVRIVL